MKWKEKIISPNGETQNASSTNPNSSSTNPVRELYFEGISFILEAAEEENRKKFFDRAKELIWPEKVMILYNIRKEAKISQRKWVIENYDTHKKKEKINIFPIYSVLLQMEDTKERDRIKSTLREEWFGIYIDELESLERKRKEAIDSGKVYTKETLLALFKKEYWVSDDFIDLGSWGIVVKSNNLWQPYLTWVYSGENELVWLHFLTSFLKDLLDKGYSVEIEKENKLELDVIIDWKLYQVGCYIDKSYHYPDSDWEVKFARGTFMNVSSYSGRNPISPELKAKIWKIIKEKFKIKGILVNIV